MYLTTHHLPQRPKNTIKNTYKKISIDAAPHSPDSLVFPVDEGGILTGNCNRGIYRC